MGHICNEDMFSNDWETRFVHLIPLHFGCESYANRGSSKMQIQWLHFCLQMPLMLNLALTGYRDDTEIMKRSTFLLWMIDI